MYINANVHYPHDEMTTFLLPVTTGCSYNQCSFCSMYLDEKYREVPLREVEMELLNGYLYTEKVFLTGGDPMSIGFNRMEEVLDLIYHYFPYCSRVASYASIKSISKYSLEELSILHNKGLRLLYIGFETGRDDILDFMNKGHSVEEAINQGKKLNKAKLQFNSIIMYGIAGRDESIKNALATAEMLNKFKTKKIITMNLTIMEGSDLSHKVKSGKFTPAGREERLLEIKALLENLKVEEQTIFDTTHPTNIIKIKGILPDEKLRLIKEVKRDGSF